MREEHAVGLAPFALPRRDARRLDNGLSVVAIEGVRSTLASACLVFDVGSARDPAGRAGLADLTVELLRRGTLRLGAPAIDEACELMGVDIRLETSRDATYVSASGPAEHVDPMLRLMAELVQRPLFEAAEVARARKRRLAQIQAGLDDPASLAGEALYRFAAEGHPYGRSGGGIASEVKRISRLDCARFHRTHLGPGRAWLVVAADVPAKRLHALVRASFGDWRSARGAPAALPPLPGVEGQRILVVHKPEATQAQVRLACRGPARGDPDIVPARVANMIFGGGFTSRLVDSVRVERGLTYGIASFLTETEAGGLFAVSTSTRTDAVAELLSIVFDQARRYRSQGPTDEELDRARRFICGQFPLQLETVEHIVRAVADGLRFGREPDWLERYRQKVMDVDAAQVRAAARRWVLPEGWAAAVVGDARALGKALRPLGVVRRVDAEWLA